MTTKKKPKKEAWDQVETLSHPESGLGVVIKERVRGRVAWSWHLIHTDRDGSVTKFIPGHIPAISQLKTDDGQPIQMEDIIFSLVKAARENIDARFAAAKMDGEKKGKKSKPRRDDKPRKERKTQGGLSSLAKKDAEAAGHDYKSPSERKKEKRAAAKANAGA